MNRRYWSIVAVVALVLGAFLFWLSRQVWAAKDPSRLPGVQEVSAPAIFDSLNAKIDQCAKSVHPWPTGVHWFLADSIPANYGNDIERGGVVIEGAFDPGRKSLILRRRAANVAQVVGHEMLHARQSPKVGHDLDFPRCRFGATDR